MDGPVTGPAAAPRLALVLTNRGRQSRRLHLKDHLGRPTTVDVAAGGSRTIDLDPVRDTHGWYDVTVSADGLPGFARRFAGHLENGRPSRTG